MNLEKKDMYPFDTVKKWLRGAYRSLTIWFNGIIGTMTAMVPLLPDYIPQLKPYLTPKIYLILLIINIFGNALLRAKTKQSLPEKGT